MLITPSQRHPCWPAWGGYAGNQGVEEETPEGALGPWRDWCCTKPRSAEDFLPPFISMTLSTCLGVGFLPAQLGAPLPMCPQLHLTCSIRST